MYCYKCGKEIDDEAVVCPGCGCATRNYTAKTIAVANLETSPKSRLVALLLCIFLGIFGVHRFYLGKIGTGLVWCFTLGCMEIGWIIDIIMLACGKMTDVDGFIVSEWNT